MKYFTCENCHFTFSRATEQEQCPDCGKYLLRPATEKEIAELMENIKDSSTQKKQDRD